jgi:hypothetical protein
MLISRDPFLPSLRDDCGVHRSLWAINWRLMQEGRYRR